MSVAMLQMRGIYKIYGAGPTEVRALDNVDLTINEGEFVAVMGPSGSGKSTCLNVLGCLDVPTAGQYFFRGVEVGTLNRDQLALLRRHYMGFVFQSFNLLPRVSALGNVEMPLIYEGIAPAKRRDMAREALRVVGLEGRESAPPSKLSGGQQQRVAIARAVAYQPEVLLMDEPCSALDPIATAQVEELIDDLSANFSVVIVTHSMQQAARVSHRTAIFHIGHLVEYELTDQIITNPRDARTESYISGRIG